MVSSLYRDSNTDPLNIQPVASSYDLHALRSSLYYEICAWLSGSTHLSCKEHYTSVMVIVREKNSRRAINSFNTQRSWEVTLVPHSILSVWVAGKSSSQHTTSVTKEHYFACLCASMAQSFLCRRSSTHNVILPAAIQKIKVLYSSCLHVNVHLQYHWACYDSTPFHYITSVHNLYLFMLYLTMMSAAESLQYQLAW
jgi:hypothetical protein